MIEDTIKFAEWMHNSYESIAEDQNWKTQKKCQVDFKDLPKRNQAVMIRMAERIKIQFHIFFDKLIDKQLKPAKKEKKENVTDHGHNWVISVLEELKKDLRREIRKE